MAKSRAAIRTVKILEMIANEKRGVTLSDLATGLDIPITSVSDIIKALLDLEMVDIIDERSKVYGIGARAYYIGNAYLANTDLIEKAKPIIEELGQMLNKTIFLGKEVNEKITYIYKYEPSAPSSPHVRLGAEHHFTARHWENVSWPMTRNSWRECEIRPLRERPDSP